jgi:hypothetical protein
MGGSAGTGSRTAESYRVRIDGPGLTIDETVSEAVARAVLRHVKLSSESSNYADEALITDVEPFRRTPENS